MWIVPDEAAWDYLRLCLGWTGVTVLLWTAGGVALERRERTSGRVQITIYAGKAVLTYQENDAWYNDFVSPFPSLQKCLRSGQMLTEQTILRHLFRGVIAAILFAPLLWGNYDLSQGSTATSTARSTATPRPAGPQRRLGPTPTPRSPVVQIGEPEWWIVPFAEGQGNPNEGKLYFAITLENMRDQPVEVGVSFRAYLADGTPHSGCYSPGGGGPGVTVNIAPHERARAVCQKSIVPRNLSGLRVTSRLWDITPLTYPKAPVRILETNFRFDDWYSDWLDFMKLTPDDVMEVVYTADALVATTKDVWVRLLFRLYDADGVQIGTCESWDELLEPEVPQRIECFMGILIDTGSPQPVSARAELMPEYP